MQKLTEDVKELLKDTGFGKEYESVTNALSRFGLTPDFEGIFTVLNAWLDPRKAIREAGPFAAVIASALGETQMNPREEFREVVLQIKKLLLEKCRNHELTGVLRTYDRLFQTLGKVGTMLFRANDRTQLQTGRTFEIPGKDTLRTQDIFTLNYDLVIESYFTEKGMGDNLFAGFAQKGMEFVYRPEAYTYGSGNTNLVKLHGSIDQFFRKGTIVKTVAPPEVSYYTREVLGEMMVYPVQEKYITRSPYFELYSVLRQWLFKDPLCVVIGYSFRDEAVNNAFTDAFDRNAALKMVCISPSASRDVSNLGDHRRRAYCIDKRFGEEEVYEEMKEAIQNWLST